MNILDGSGIFMPADEELLGEELVDKVSAELVKLVDASCPPSPSIYPNAAAGLAAKTIAAAPANMVSFINFILAPGVWRKIKNS
ncbi:hypothetical protein [Sphingorhabdus sp. EL138]|uniref:hypothetical protein n=1 Tax=Sphingorhabdus sp. EL138 TaxID=2073156 RepID=UPI0020B14B50|nr:hypothetical protein [Sphingorhabdus sp. EL138]